MEIIGEGLIAIGNAIEAFIWATAFVYVIGIVTKTALVAMDKARPEELKSWTDLQIWKKKNGNNW